MPSVALHVVEFTFSRGFESYLRSHSFFFHLLDCDIVLLRRLWGLFEGPRWNFHSSQHIGSIAEGLAPNVPVTLRHADRGRGRSPHHDRHYRLRNAGFQQSRYGRVAEIVESTLEGLGSRALMFSIRRRIRSRFTLLTATLGLAG